MVDSNVRSWNKLDCDVLVAGGGISGVCAAVQAARSGAKVILCHDRPVLGGNASSEIRMHICGADIAGHRGKEFETEVREGGIVEEIRLENAVRNPQRCSSMMDLILYELCLEESNLTLLLNTTVIAVKKKRNVIKSAIAVRESTEEGFLISGKVFMDCTGDGRLAAEAGASFRKGRESFAEYNEEYAAGPDEKHLGSSLLFEAVDMGRPVPFVPPKWARKFSEDDLRHRDHSNLGYGYWWIEWGGELDTIKDNPKIQHELLRILFGVWDHIKNGGDHGAENYALTWFGFLPGKRESRRYKGQYVFTGNDAKNAPHFDDAIAYGGWPLDVHIPQGIDSKEEPNIFPFTKYIYSIPLRICTSDELCNLMFAGRNVSATHIGFSTLRVMATCGVVGQGAGAAAAAACRNNIYPSNIVNNRSVMQEIQKDLIRNDCYLPGIYIKDELDIAAEAKVEASSQQPSGRAINILTQVNRAVCGENALHPRYGEKGTNRWMSDPQAGLPAWIELRWDAAVEISEVQIIFDTGLHRPLTLSKDDQLNRRMIWGPQPETVKSYCLVGRLADGQNVVLAVQKDNYKRRVVHSFDRKKLTSIRLEIAETHGVNYARVYAIRCYNRFSNQLEFLEQIL